MQQIKKKFYTDITIYNPRNIKPPRASKYEQDGGNCRLYAGMNNLYFNTGIITDVEDFKLYLKSKRISTKGAGTSYTTAFTLSMYNKDKKIMGYGFSILENTKLFGELLSHGYSFIYSRINNTELLQDIYKDDEVDFVRQKRGRNSGEHSTNIRFEDGKLKEYGTWGNSVFNEFTYDSVDLFIKAVKAGVIRDKIFFLDFEQ